MVRTTKINSKIIQTITQKMKYNNKLPTHTCTQTSYKPKKIKRFTHAQSNYTNTKLKICLGASTPSGQETDWAHSTTPGPTWAKWRHEIYWLNHLVLYKNVKMPYNSSSVWSNRPTTMLTEFSVSLELWRLTLLTAAHWMYFNLR